MQRREFLQVAGGLAAAAALPPLAAAASGPGASEVRFVSSSDWGGTVECLVVYAADGDIRACKTEDETWIVRTCKTEDGTWIVANS